MSCSNLKVSCIRDGLTEEFHEGIVQFSGSDAIDTSPYYLRSCAKPLQASLLIDYEIDFTDKELALCSGSHSGEECHVEVAKGILKKLDLDESFLKCGIHLPLSRTMQDKMLLKGEKPSPIHNNCSGKHLGFMAICKKKGWDLNSYYEPNHPLQTVVRNKINLLCEIKENYPLTTDGCGVPIVSMPLKNILIGYKNLVENYPVLISAITENPYFFGGESRLDTEIIQNSNGKLLAKVGAGGLCVVFNISKKEGFVVKMFDANNEARKLAVFDIINNLGWANIEYDNKIRTINGKIVGEKITTICS